MLAVVLSLLLVQDAQPFAPHPRQPSTTLFQPLQFSSFGQSINDDDKPNLPPGRRTPRFVSFLFDDTLKLLKPKTMASYQVDRTKQYGDIFKTNIFGKPTVFVTSKDTISELGKEEARSGTMEAFFPPHHQTLFGPQSLIVQSGDTHSRLRRLIQPVLSPTVTASLYQPIIMETLDELLTSLQAEEDYFEMVPKLRSFFITIALQILLGKSTEVPEGMAEDLTLWSNGLLAAPLTFVPWSTAAKAVRARKRICATMEPLLEQERQNPSNSLLGRLVTSEDENGNKLSNEDILDNVLTIIFAGSDTTASAATSLMLTLSLHPKLKEELKAGTIGADAVVQQVLANYPPAPFQMRLIKETASVKNFDIPADWLVVYGFAGALVSEPMDVLQQMEDNKTAAAGSLAFGAGPRMCPGRYLAAMELVILCGKLARCDWELMDDQNLEQSYTPGFFPKDGLKLRFC